MPSKRPRRRGLHAHLVQVIAVRIVTGAYLEGEALPRIELLATDFGSSRVAVREALRVLVEKGLIESRQKSGTRVRPRSTWNLADPDVIAWQALANPSLAFFRDLTEVRAMVEPFAANLAASRATNAERQHLRALLAKMESTMDQPSEFAAADLELHSAILAASHNMILLHLTQTIAEALAASRAVTTQSHAASEAAQPMHDVVVSEIVAGRGEQASQAMRILIGEAFVDIKSIIEDRQIAQDSTPPIEREVMTRGSAVEDPRARFHSALSVHSSTPLPPTDFPVPPDRGSDSGRSRDGEVALRSHGKSGLVRPSDRVYPRGPGPTTK